MLHRIFIAINLPDALRKKLLNFSKKYPKLPARWTTEKNIHITLNFLGILNDNQLLETIKTVKEILLGYSPFLVKINRICYGPPKKFPPQIVWAIGEKNQEILVLQNNLENTLFGLPIYQYKIKEKRRFSPHVTLARIKSFEFRRLSEEPEINEDVDLSFEVNSIEVMESQPKINGVEYTILESIKLSKTLSISA